MTAAGRSPLRGRWGITLVALPLLAVFIALGTWQLERRAWKHALIARVEQRLAEAAVEAPGRAAWPGISADRDEYRRVHVTGHYLIDRDTRVQASTEWGAGFWLLTPLQRADGSVVLVNRGFVPPGDAGRASATAAAPGPASAASDEVSLSGLLRLSEPRGGFLRDNDPAGGRWYSRDVMAIAAAHGLHDVAPYFVDADADAEAGSTLHASAGSASAPIGGLTVIAFRDNHAVYALTWFALAAMVGWFWRRWWRESSRPDAEPENVSPAAAGSCR